MSMLHALILLAAEAPAEAKSDSGVITVLITAASAAVAALATAFGPVAVEAMKNRGKSAAPAAPAPKPEQPEAMANLLQGATLIEQAVADYRAQRDDAMRRYYGALDELEDERETNRVQSVRIATLEAALGPRHSPRYYPDDQQNWGRPR